MQQRHQGLIAATLTPMHANGTLNLSVVGEQVERLIRQGVRGMYVCGSTGEGVSLTSSERKQVAAEFVKAANGRLQVFVQVGHNSLFAARELAVHAAEIGADAVSATCPSYFKIGSVEALTQCMIEIAAGAPELPFYYYHIPTLTGNSLQMTEFLATAGDRIPNLAGLKFTTPELHLFQRCRELQDGRFEVFWGTDEMLLPALACGAESAIGSTYNIASPLYVRIWEAYLRGDILAARALQSQAIEMIAILVDYPFHAALKRVMQCKGLDLGPCRLPLAVLQPQQAVQLEKRLDAIGFFDWSEVS